MDKNATYGVDVVIQLSDDNFTSPPPIPSKKYSISKSDPPEKSTD